MKYSTCFVLLGCVFLNSIHALPIDKTDNPCVGIPTEDEVLLPHPTNCSAFIQCSNGAAVEMPCPDELQWNNGAKQCDFIGDCKLKLQLHRINKVYVGLVSQTCAGVPESTDVLLPNPADCGTYLQCVHQTPVVRPCPAGLHWSVQANRCEWPELANCKSNNCEGVPETVDVLLPNPEDCNTYIQCVHQQPVVRPCPAGLEWSIAANRCEWPDIAQCSVINP